MKSTASSGGAAGRNIGRMAAVLMLIGLLSAPATARADVVLDWNAIAARTFTRSMNPGAVPPAPAPSPFHQARLMSITQLAVFEAVNSVTGEYEPYLAAPIVAPLITSAEAAAIAAAHKVLKTFYTLNPDVISEIDNSRAAALAAIEDGPAKANGIAVGDAAAAALLALRASDGSAPPAFYLPSSPGLGEWQTTPSCSPAGGAFYQWQNVTPFAIDGPDQFLLPAPPALTSNRYAKDFQEVKTVGAVNSAARPADRTEVARLYGATSPSFALSMATRQLAAAKLRSLTGNARALALIMMSTNDSLIASFYNKYHYNVWRPETGIVAAAVDGNDKTDVDATFVPFIATCLPSYPSNHASGTNGGLEMMRRLFGAAGHDITLSNGVPAIGPLPAGVITKHYSQLKQISDDVDDARVYGGIHWRYDQEAGNALGRAIATHIYQNYLRPAHGQP